jgi:hypothetical protein
MFLLVLVAELEVIGAEAVVHLPVLQHVIDGCENGGGGPP